MKTLAAQPSCGVFVLRVLCICAGVVAACRVDAQVHPEVIQGRVTAADGTPIRAARTIVTRGPDRAVFESVSSEDGRYRIAIDSGTGDYLVYVASPTPLRLQPFRRRVTRQASTDSIFVVDAVLKPLDGAQQLATVRVLERKPTPSRADGLRVGPGGSEAPEAGVAAALLPEQRGDLAATSATIAGATPAGGGVSVFGLPTSQNSVTLNGLAFPGAVIPRDAQTLVRVATAAYDPARGWFSGAEMRIDLSHDFVFASRVTSSSLDVRAFQAGDAVSSRTGQNFTNVTQGAGATGTVARGTLTYNVSAQAGRRSSNIATLGDLDDGLLQRAGVARDSVVRLLQLAAQAGVPLRRGGAPMGETTDRASLLLGLSTLSNDPDSFRARRHMGSVTLYASRDETAGAGLHALATAGAGGRTSFSSGSVQAGLSSFLSPDLLLEVRSALSVSDHRASPYLALPAADVLVGSSFPSAASGLAVLAIGGAPSGNAFSRTLTWETQADSRFYTSIAHRMRISAALRYDALTRVAASNAFGTFFFASLSDLATNRPALFTRTLGTPERHAGVWNGFMSIGDYWRAGPTFELLYGARIEGNVFALRPQYNPAVDAAFGVRTDRVPNTAHISPRIGFTWTVGRSQVGGYTVRNEHGVFVAPSVGVLRGGVGEFRSLMVPSLLANASVDAGLSTGVRQIVCAGAAVPTPVWASFVASLGAIPQDCVAAIGAPASRDETSPLQLLDGHFTAGRSWRANVSWTSHLGAIVWSIDGAYSLNLNQPGQVDLNFNGTPRLFLGGEGDRPVYVPLSSIVPASGTVLGGAARRTDAYGSVMMVHSELRSSVAQATLTVLPDLARFVRSRMFASLSYTMASARTQQGGFDGSTFGSPLTRAWSPGPFTPTHAFLVQVSVKTQLLTIGLFARLASGLPYTPMVGSDINGDGLANDRAFVLDPSRTSDQSAASAMRELLTGGSRGVRECLRRQLGEAALVSSCKGPWTATANARLQLNTGGNSGWTKRVSASLYFANPLGGLDQLLHGPRVRGWGDRAVPDQTLLRVVGFDPTATRFRYAVNPRFGDTRPTANLNGAPFRVILDIRLDLGRPSDEQILDRSLQPGRGGYQGPRRTAEQIKRFYQRALPQPFPQVLALTDSLLLTTDQVRALLEGQARYNARADSAVSAFSMWLAGLPDRYDAPAALRQQDELLAVILNIGREEVQRTMPGVLNAVQVRLLPWPADIMLRSATPLTIRDIRR